MHQLIQSFTEGLFFQKEVLRFQYRLYKAVSRVSSDRRKAFQYINIAKGPKSKEYE